MQRRAAHTHSGVADYTVQSAVVSHSRIYKGFQLLSIAAIRLQKNGITAISDNFIHHSLTLIRTSGGANNLHTIFRKDLCGCPADAPGCPGNDGHFSLNTAEIHE